MWSRNPKRRDSECNCAFWKHFCKSFLDCSKLKMHFVQRQKRFLKIGPCLELHPPSTSVKQRRVRPGPGVHEATSWPEDRERALSPTPGYGDYLGKCTSDAKVWAVRNWLIITWFTSLFFFLIIALKILDSLVISDKRSLWHCTGEAIAASNP